MYAFVYFCVVAADDARWGVLVDDLYFLVLEYDAYALEDDVFVQETYGGGYYCVILRFVCGQVIVNWIGVLMSVVLIIGILVWGYWLIVRDVIGVLVVRALEGLVCYVPEDPGGR